MRAVRCAAVVFVGAFSALFSAGCGTIEPLSDRASDPRLVSSAHEHRPPAWLTAGSAPLPTTIPALPKLSSLPEPDLTAAQNEPALSVPRIEEERAPANHSVAGSPLAVTPVSAASPIEPISPNGPLGPMSPASPTSPASPIAEPDWKPAGRRGP